MSEAEASDKVTQSIHATREAHAILLKGIDDISAKVAEGDTSFKVEIGSLLWDLGNAIEKAMKTIKEDVRTEAWDTLGGAIGNTTIAGTDLGEATVTIPKATLQVPKGKNIDDIKKAVGSDFSLFFEETLKYVPRKEFEERVAKLENALHKQILMDAIERKEATPRVSFRRHPPAPGENG